MTPSVKDSNIHICNMVEISAVLGMIRYKITLQYMDKCLWKPDHHIAKYPFPDSPSAAVITSTLQGRLSTGFWRVAVGIFVHSLMRVLGGALVHSQHFSLSQKCCFG